MFTNSHNSDAIGIQIFKNPLHLSSMDWYRSSRAEGGQGFAGNVQTTKLGGYEAVTDGNNYYVSALNYSSGNIYDLVYLYSINSDAKPETRKIFEELARNFRLNTNLSYNDGFCGSTLSAPNFTIKCSSDLDCPTGEVCSNQVEKLQRNHQRLIDLKMLDNALVKYSLANLGNYPSIGKTSDIFKLAATAFPGLKNGSYLAGQSISTWPSWTAIGSDLGIAMPLDPVNELAVAGSCGNKSTFCTTNADCGGNIPPNCGANPPCAEGYVCNSGTCTKTGEICNNGIDDDKNGQKDCTDNACLTANVCLNPGGSVNICTLHDLVTGWSTDESRYSFSCNSNSYAYRYISNGADFEIRTRFEDPGINITNLVSFIDSFKFSNRNRFPRIADWTNINNAGICANVTEISSSNSGSCGDGVINPGQGEECEPKGSVVYDRGHCSLDGMADKKQCDNNCHWQVLPDVTCLSLAKCGNSIIEPGETCDAGFLNGRYNECNTTCTGPNPPYDPSNPKASPGYCGDNQTNPKYEVCDPATTGISYGGLNKNSVCTKCTSFGPYCGDGNKDASFGEDCDNSDTGPMKNGTLCVPTYGNSCTYCGSSCKFEIRQPLHFCGDGTTDTADGEVCDKGSALNGTFGSNCSTDCKTSCTDLDRDGYGDVNGNYGNISGCLRNEPDCDDNPASHVLTGTMGDITVLGGNINPGQLDDCTQFDGIDNNCNGSVDEDANANTILTNVDFESGAVGGLPTDWYAGGQKASSVGIVNNEAYSGTKSVLLHQNPNQAYPGTCSQALCTDPDYPYVSNCTWDAVNRQCVFNRGDLCHSATPAVYSEGETLCWEITNRRMWLSLSYDLSNFPFMVGERYTIKFNYKGNLDFNGSLLPSFGYNLGWHSQCYSQSMYWWWSCASASPPYSGISNTNSDLCLIHKNSAANQTDCYESVYTPTIPDGNYPNWNVYSSSFVYTAGMSQIKDNNGNNQYSFGISAGYNSTGAAGSDMYIDDFQVLKCTNVTGVPSTCVYYCSKFSDTCRADGTRECLTISKLDQNCTGGTMPNIATLTRACTPDCTSYSCAQYEPICPSSGKKACTQVGIASPPNCKGVVPDPSTLPTQDCTPACTSYNCTSWSGICRPIDSKEVCTAVEGDIPGCIGTPPDPATITRDCTYTPDVCTSYLCAQYGPCQSDNNQPCVVTGAGQPNGCVGTPPDPSTLSGQQCTYTPPPISCDAYQESDCITWSGLCVSGYEECSVLTPPKPQGCVGATNLTRACCPSYSGCGTSADGGVGSTYNSTPGVCRCECAAGESVLLCDPIRYCRVTGTPPNERVSCASPATQNVCSVGGVCPATHDPVNNECNTGQECLDMGYCFAGETKVLTPLGYRNIKDLQVGDEVIAYDELYNLNFIATVVNYLENTNHDYFLINNTIKVTPEHFFAVINEGPIVWTKAKNLKIGDKLKNSDGEKITIESIEKVFSAEGIQVYNPTLTWPNTYYVLMGDKPILVHNAKSL